LIDQTTEDPGDGDRNEAACTHQEKWNRFVDSPAEMRVPIRAGMTSPDPLSSADGPSELGSVWVPSPSRLACKLVRPSKSNPTIISRSHGHSRAFLAQFDMAKARQAHPRSPERNEARPPGTRCVDAQNIRHPSEQTNSILLMTGRMNVVRLEGKPSKRSELPPPWLDPIVPPPPRSSKRTERPSHGWMKNP
jgi:hypothetical protein